MLDARICRRSSLMLALGCSRKRAGGSPCRYIQGCLELLPLYSASVCPRHSPPAMSGKAPGNSRPTARISRIWRKTRVLIVAEAWLDLAERTTPLVERESGEAHRIIERPLSNV